MTATLQVENLETQFPTRDGIVRAVDGVSFAVEAGEILGLVGESGSGKSITGFTILGLIDPPGRIANGSVISLGFAQAGAKAVININSYAVLEGGGAVNVTSDASATARMASATEREDPSPVLGYASKPRRNSAFAASLAVTNADVVSKTTVAEHAVVHGGRTVNVRALGASESEAESESGLFANGTAAHAMDFDHSFTLMGQPTAPIIPAVFALGETLSAGGRQILEAYTAGFEVTGKLAYSLRDTNAHRVRQGRERIRIGVHHYGAPERDAPR